MFVQCLIVVIFILIIVDKFRPKRFVKLHQQLRNDWSHLPIIGNALHVIGNNEDIFKAFADLSSQAYKKKNGTICICLGLKFMIGIADPLQAIAVLKAAFNKSFIYRISTHLLGNGVIFAPANIWHRKRKILAPTFASRNVNKFVKVFEANAKEVAKQMQLNVGKGNFSCWNYISPYSLDSVCESIFAVKMGALKQPDQPFFKAFQEYLKNTGQRVSKPWLSIDSLYRLLPVYKIQAQSKDTIHKFVDNIICTKKASIKKDLIPDKPKNKETNFKTFLELMIESSEENGKGYTNEELRDEVLSLVLAATDTSATGACLVFLLLSQHQDVQEKIYKEIQEVLGDLERPIEYEDLQKLNYMEAVIKETLRLYPPVPFISRDSKEEYSLPSGLTVPKKIEVIISILGIQRNPKYWGDDADVFKPERFLSEKNQIPGAFLTFGYGPRNCPGQLYAFLSMKTILVTILRHYRLLPATSFIYNENTPLRLSFEIMIKHVNNFELQVEHRNAPIELSN